MKKQWLGVALVSAAVLAGCGGGGDKAGDNPFDSSSSSGGSGGSTGGNNTGSGSTVTDTVGTINMSLSSDTVSAAQPVIVTVTVRDSKGQPVVGRVVDFTTRSGRGLLNNATDASALTNSEGIARVTLTPTNAAVSNADEVIATISLTGGDLTVSRGFQLTQSTVSISSLASSVGPSGLSPYAQATVSVGVSGSGINAPVVVNLSSTCVAAGKAELSPASVTTNTGQATFIYKDKGCGQSNQSDTLQATISGSTDSRQLSFALIPPSVGSIEFASASPELIYLRGSGFTDVSVIEFVVRDSGQTALGERDVLVELLTLSGGVTLVDGVNNVSSLTRKSDAEGRVRVNVRSGTVPTPVRVKATVAGTVVSTVSSNLSVGVGLPTQLNFTLAQETINIEGYDRSGTQNRYTVIASDRTGNPVPIGTSVNFVTEGSGGQIEAASTVKLVNGSTNAAVSNFQSARAAKSIQDGRLTVVAYALGEESCKDLNGNNICDPDEPFQDLGNIYKDITFNGTYEASRDEFVSTDISASRACAARPDLALYPEYEDNVSLPTIAGTCDGEQGRAYVRRAAETVLSTSSASPVWLSTTQNSGAVAIPAGCSSREVYDGSAKTVDNTSRFALINGTSWFGMPTVGALTFLAADSNPLGRFNPMPAGTVISATATTGLTVAVSGGSPVANSSVVTSGSVKVQFDSASSGVVTLNFAAPSGFSTSVSFNVNTAATLSGACAP